ncbi:M16 family metallopeptidase [Thalassotalea hakodatensis]|uniref:M16 family metallopeptidase n=1 Tax=Thalassotalea hakodatensis TaxID=3030492 RepID=UPI002574628E|nr:pitrilysin family protein [Thalassotalea hakodatensis]
MKIYNALLAIFFTLISQIATAGYTLPSYEKVTLQNGLTVILMEQHEVPLIDVNIVVNVGAIDDANNAGLSYLTAQNLLLGTKHLSKTQLDQQIDFVGAELYSTANLEFSTIGASFAVKDTDNIMNILRDAVLFPRFDETEFNKHKSRHALQLTQRKESPRSVINQYFNRLIFGQNGYGAVTSGDQESIKSISLPLIQQHHSKWYTANNAAIIVVGDFETNVMKEKIKKLFSSWSSANPALQQQDIKKTPHASSPQVLLVNKGDARESTFLIGGKGIARNNPDIVGLSVINTILGGRFTSWLNDELRVNAGLTYGARSRFTSYSHDGTFTISTFTKTETTIEAIDLALKTYQRLWQQGIDSATLTSAKAYVKGQFPPKFETASQLADLLANMYGYGFDESYINTFEQQVDSLTIEKSQQLINSYFPKENLQFVVIGKAEQIRTALAKYGKITETDIKESGFNIQ